MKSRVFDARRLDVRAFAKVGATLAGDWPIAGFERLRDVMATSPDLAFAPSVHWQADGVERQSPDGARQVWLRLHAEAALPLVCQRCLEPVVQSLAFDREFLFVADEARAAELDAGIEQDVLVFSRELDLHALLEDELLLDLPLVPRHERCPGALDLPVADRTAAERENPFAALSRLRRDPR